jgi:hypothetical protein
MSGVSVGQLRQFYYRARSAAAANIPGIKTSGESIGPLRLFVAGEFFSRIIQMAGGNSEICNFFQCAFRCPHRAADPNYLFEAVEVYLTDFPSEVLIQGLSPSLQSTAEMLAGEASSFTSQRPAQGRWAPRSRNRSWHRSKNQRQPAAAAAAAAPAPAPVAAPKGPKPTSA